MTNVSQIKYKTSYFINPICFISVPVVQKEYSMQYIYTVP